MKKHIIIIIAAIACVISTGIIVFTIFFGGKTASQKKSMPLNLGQKFLSELNYDQAVAQFENVISIEPKNTQAYLDLAKSYEYMGDIDSAEKTLQNGYEATGSDLIKRRMDELSNINTSASAGQTPGVTLVEIGGRRYPADSKELILRGCALTDDDLANLGEFKELEWLDISNNNITDISAVKNVTTLKKFYASNNKITDTSPLESLTELKYAGLRNNKIISADGLLKMSGLEYLHLSDNQITDISSIGSNLKLLYVANNKISNIDIIRDSTGLIYFDISGN